MNNVDIYIIVKEEGTLLYKYSILGDIQNERDQLLSGFLTAINTFAKDIGWPAGVSLIRSGTLEARFASGDYIFSVLIIDFSKPLSDNTEPILSGIAQEVAFNFEKKYKNTLKKKYFDISEFKDFRESINTIIQKYEKETLELYQKLVLIEAMYAKVPQKWCIPLIEKVSNGENVLKEFPALIKKYPNMKKAIEKVNFSNAPVWEIFQIPTYKI
ncbi:MAG: hypothetical protein ACTSRZ_18540 [Promethearchaeota archaeon]